MARPTPACRIQPRMRHCSRPKSLCASTDAIWRSLYISTGYRHRPPSGSIRSGCSSGVLMDFQPFESKGAQGVHGWPFKTHIMYWAAATAAMANTREKASCLSAIMLRTYHGRQNRPLEMTRPRPTITSNHDNWCTLKFTNCDIFCNRRGSSAYCPNGQTGR